MLVNKIDPNFARQEGPIYTEYPTKYLRHCYSKKIYKFMYELGIVLKIFYRIC